MGNRFEHLQNAIDYIFIEIGNVLKISSIYETPAFGFEGDAFLNCAILIESDLNPLTVLRKALEVEKRMGRSRGNPKIYSSRPIDIDIVFIDDQIITSEKLQVPHPEMQNRNFVLAPMLDINPDLMHPIFKKDISQLMTESTDNSKLSKYSEELINPRSRYNIEKYNYIAIEGNIGAGKTSLVSKIANDFNAQPILERFKDNPFLPKFYKDPSRYAFSLEMSFLADRYQQLMDDIAQFDLFRDNVISDYDINKSLIFANITLTEEEFSLYKKLFQVMQKDFPKPDLYVYLFQNTDRLLQNIQNRGRKYEQSIEATYLDKVNSGYLEFIKNQHNDDILIIDVSEFDFMKDRKDYIKILNQLFL